MKWKSPVFPAISFLYLVSGKSSTALSNMSPYSIISKKRNVQIFTLNVPWFVAQVEIIAQLMLMYFFEVCLIKFGPVNIPHSSKGGGVMCVTVDDVNLVTNEAIFCV